MAKISTAIIRRMKAANLFRARIDEQYRDANLDEVNQCIAELESELSHMHYAKIQNVRKLVAKEKEEIRFLKHQLSLWAYKELIDRANALRTVLRRRNLDGKERRAIEKRLASLQRRLDAKKYAGIKPVVESMITTRQFHPERKVNLTERLSKAEGKLELLKNADSGKVVMRYKWLENGRMEMKLVYDQGGRLLDETNAKKKALEHLRRMRSELDGSAERERALDERERQFSKGWNGPPRSSLPKTKGIRIRSLSEAEKAERDAKRKAEQAERDAKRKAEQAEEAQRKRRQAERDAERHAMYDAAKREAPRRAKERLARLNERRFKGLEGFRL